MDHRDRYKGFLMQEGEDIPRSELAVRIKYDDQIIAIINLEHPSKNAFRYQHVNAILSAADFLACLTL